MSVFFEWTHNIDTHTHRHSTLVASLVLDKANRGQALVANQANDVLLLEL